MKVQIISIKLDVLDSSTKTENDFLIGDYIVDYEVWFPPLKHTHITGQLLIKLYPVDDNTTLKQIILNKINNVWEGVEEKL